MVVIDRQVAAVNICTHTRFTMFSSDGKFYKRSLSISYDNSALVQYDDYNDP